MKTAIAAILALGLGQGTAQTSEYADARIRVYANEVAPLPPRGEAFPPSPQGGSGQARDLNETYADQALKLAEQFLKAHDHDAARFLAGLAGSKTDSAKERADKILETIKASTVKAVAGREAETAIAALGKRWAGEWRKIAPKDPRLQVEAEILDALVEHAKALALFNRRRSEAGIGKVDYDFSLSYGCQMHAKYLALHPDTENPHTEEEKASGYSEEGKKAAENSVVGGDESFLAEVQGQLATLYHRKRMLDETTQRIGLGNALSKRRFIVIDLGSATDGKDSDDGIAYPPNGVVDVRLTMEPENPSPVPPDAEAVVGYPVSLTFADDDADVTEVKASLTDNSGRKVECFMSSPEKTACKKFEKNWGIVGLIPKMQLKAKTTYKAVFEYSYKGQKAKKEWSFTTQTK